MKKAVTAKKSSAKEADGPSPSRLIDGRIKELGDWRGETLGRIRASRSPRQSPSSLIRPSINSEGEAPSPV